jgi:hypothetical protein
LALLAPFESAMSALLALLAPFESAMSALLALRRLLNAP